jgi:hypothetical protein
MTFLHPRPFSNARKYFLVSPIAMVLLGFPCTAGMPIEISAAQVFKTWEAEQKKIYTARIKWSETVTITKEAIAASRKLREARRTAMERAGFKDAAVDSPLDAKDASVTRNQTNDFVLQGEDWRWNSDGFVGVVSQREELVVKDGLARSYMPKGADSYAIGNISKVSEKRRIPLAEAGKPLFFVLRSSSFSLFDKSLYSVSKDFGVIDKARCAILTPSKPGWVLWVELDTEGFPLRRAERGALQIELSYKKENGALLLHRWSIITAPAGIVRESIRANVTDCVYNGSIDASEFELKFPSGTWVRDFTRPSDLGDRTEFIIREDGQNRKIIRGDIGASYDRLVTTDPGYANAPEATWLSSGWFLAVNVLVFLSLATYFVRVICKKVHARPM